ncbi:tetratricopeptide repeat protein [Thermogemmatispora sp.]|uniref:tetratricopeptide repeat protein n=1 Tax=Thermogemmatispora sp. TaxID=1968838 RepID=UPI001DB62ACE|nr:tetratricopeptide repeat protein [Thermogemmatispora sp.]MBX5448912.1 tetratricopeptide repeat protein [Thermogemmatispora sp.]
MNPTSMFTALSIFTTFASIIPVYHFVYRFLHIAPFIQGEGPDLLLYPKSLHQERQGHKAQATALARRATVYLHRGQPQRAIELYNRALALADDEAGLYLGRGEACYQAGQYQQALSDCERALHLLPMLAEAHYLRGRVCARLAAYHQALASYTRALELEPRLAAAIYPERASLYQRLKKPHAALHDYCRALEYHPQEASLIFQRALLYLHLREPRQAIADLNSVLEARPNFACAYHYRALASLYLHDLRRARQDCQRAITLNPMHIDHGWLACWVALCEERPDAAMAERLEALARNAPEQYVALLCWAVSAWIRGEQAAAQAALSRAQACVGPDEHWDAPFWQAVIWATVGCEADAHQALHEALIRGLPLPLLSPLRWAHPAFYAHYASALLEA